MAQGHTTPAAVLRRLADRLDRRAGVNKENPPPAEERPLGRKMQSLTVYLRPDQTARLDAEADRTRLPVAVLIRDAIDAAYPPPGALPLARGRVAHREGGQSEEATEVEPHTAPVASRAPTRRTIAEVLADTDGTEWDEPEPGTTRFLTAPETEDP